MGWLQRLLETYDACAGRGQFADDPLPPVSHTPQQAHVEIVVDGEGTFRRARLVQKEETLIPATEHSANRVGTRPPPYPCATRSSMWRRTILTMVAPSRRSMRNTSNC